MFRTFKNAHTELDAISSELSKELETFDQNLFGFQRIPSKGERHSSEESQQYKSYCMVS